MVERYAPKEYRQGLCLDDEGEFVRYSDYAALEARLAEKVRVKPLQWNECRALYGGRKLVATDCFGREYARLDLKGQSDDFINDFKARVQEAYNTVILSTLEATPAPQPLGEEDYEEIISAAAINMRKATSGLRGQVITAQDSIDWWVMKETERRILSALEATPATEQRKLSLANERIRDLEKHVSSQDAYIDALEAQLAEAAKERDEALEELGKVIMECPVGQRSMPISRAVASMRAKLSALETTPAPEQREPSAEDVATFDRALLRNGRGAEATPLAPMVMECVTEGCAQPATVRFGRGGVSSDYCYDCYMRIQALTTSEKTS